MRAFPPFGDRLGSATALGRQMTWVLGSMGAIVAVILLWTHNPENSALFPPCPVHWATGLHCPGCGTLRAIHRLLHGDLYGALSFNALLVLSMPALLLLILRPSFGRIIWVPPVVLFVLVGFGIARNIPLWPFVLLAPG